MSREIIFSIGSKSAKGLLWDAVQNPKAVVQIVHGMAEHISRYEEFAWFLNNKGIIAGGHDHAGHGMNARAADPGDFSHEGWTGLVRTAGGVHDELKRLYPDKPLYLLGHSMGSIVVRCLMHIRKPELAGVVLSGVGLSSGAEQAFGRIISSLDAVISGPQKPARITGAIHYKQYANHFPGDGLFGWLSSDAAQVALYEKDLLCGFYLPAASYRQLLSGSEWADQLERSMKPLAYPVLIVGGSLDPVGHQGKDPCTVFKRYEAFAKEGSELKIYSDMRHEVLNESHRLQVYGDIVHWIEGTLKRFR